MRFVASGNHRPWFVVSAVSVSTLALLLTTVGIAAAAPPTKTDNTVYFDSATYEVSEGDGCVSIGVDRSVTKGKAPIVTVATSDGSATVADGDYTAVNTTVSFPRGGQGSFCVPILVDGVIGEPDETFTVTLSVSASSRGWIAGTPATATVTIHEATAPSPPTDLTAELVSATVDVPYVHLTWTNPDGYYGAYWIGKSTTSSGPYTEVATAMGISYDVTPAPSVGTYYVVAAMNRDTLSSYAGPVFAAGYVPGSGLYWATGAGTSGTIKAANPDGSGVQTLVTGQNSPFGVAVNATHIYWADTGDDTIMMANLDGSNPAAIVSVSAGSHPYGVTLDSNYVYWTNLGGQTIYRANLDGSNPTLLVNGTGMLEPASIAVDGTHIYFGDIAGNGSIMMAPLSGGAWQALVGNQTYPFGIAVYGSHIYWTDCGDNTAANGTIMQADLDGTNVTPLATGQAHPVGIAVNSSHIYWANANSGEILSSNLSGGGVTTLVSGQSYLNGVAVAP